MRHLSHHHEDETELAQLGHFSEDYGDEPIFKCQNCASKNPGYEEKEASLLTIIAAVLCLIIFRLYSFLILPLVVESTKTIIKKCVKCDHVLDKQELLSMPSLTDKILSFKCGSCAMVISRKYALVLIAILSVIWFMIPSSTTSITNPGGLDLTTVRWDQFVEDCGRKVVLSNQVRAKKSFDNKYANNIIQWEGVVHTLYSRKDIKNNPFIGYLILIKMNPSDANSEFADFQLVFSNALASKYGETLNIIEIGDVLEFKGYLRTMGDEFRFHEIEVINIHLTGKKTNINDIPMISYTGNASNMRRYKPEELGSSEPKDKPKTSETPQAPVETKTSPAKTDDDNKSQDQPKVEQTSQNNQPEPEPEKVTITEPEPEPVLADDQTNDQTNDQVNNDQTNDQTIDNIAEPPQDAAGDDQINQDQGGDQFVASNDQVDQANQAVTDDQATQASEPAAVQNDQQQVDDNVVIVDTNTDTGDVNANANV